MAEQPLQPQCQGDLRNKDSEIIVGPGLVPVVLLATGREDSAVGFWMTGAVGGMYIYTQSLD